MNTKKLIGRNIQFFLEKHHMRQADLYRKIGSNSASLNEWIHGKKMPEIESLEKIAAVFCVPVSEFFIDRFGINDEDENKAALSYYRFLNSHASAKDIVDGMMTLSDDELDSLRVIFKRINAFRKKEV